MSSPLDKELEALQTVMIAGLAREMKSRGTKAKQLSLQLGGSPNLITKLLNGDRKVFEGPLIAKIARVWRMKPGTLLDRLLKEDKKAAKETD